MTDTPRMTEQERQRLLSQYAEIATLAGGLAHEIKNPLSTMRLNLELLLEELEEDDSPHMQRRVAKVRTALSEAEHLQGILDDFLQFARVGELEPTDQDLNAIVNDFIEFYQPRAGEAGIEISPHLAHALPTVSLDRARIRQVLMNLTLNAEQAMPDGGMLEIQTFTRDGSVVLELIDTGVGMDERAREQMFQVFFSTKQGGSGLGLPTVRKIVQAHHGTIACDSEPGRGTRFTIAFPVESPETTETATNGAEPRP